LTLTVFDHLITVRHPYSTTLSFVCHFIWKLWQILCLGISQPRDLDLNFFISNLILHLRDTYGTYLCRSTLSFSELR